MVRFCLPGASLVPRRLSNWSFPASLVPPWCLAGCPIGPFLPPWCLPGASQAPAVLVPRLGCPLVLSGLSGASLVPRKLSKWSFPAPWCLPGCPNGPFLPPWCLPGASQAVQLVLSCLPGASLVPRSPIGPFRSPWCLPGASYAVQMVLPCSLVPPWCLSAQTESSLALADYWSHPVLGI